MIVICIGCRATHVLFIITKVQALIAVTLEPTMAKSIYTRLLVLLLLSIPNQPVALVEVVVNDTQSDSIQYLNFAKK